MTITKSSAPLITFSTASLKATNSSAAIRPNVSDKTGEVIHVLSTKRCLAVTGIPLSVIISCTLNLSNAVYTWDLEPVLTADWVQRQNACSSAYINPLTWWRMLTEGRTWSHSWMSRRTEHLNANTKAFTRTQGTLHKPHSMYKYRGMCKSTPTHMETWWNTQSDALVRLSKVWLEALLACDLFVVSHCYGVYTFIPSYRRKTSSSLCYSTTNPSFSFLSLFFSFTFYCVFPTEGKEGYIFFVFSLPFLSSSISCPRFPNLLC